MKENMLYKIKAQKVDNSINITAETSNDVSLEEAINIAKEDVILSPLNTYRNFIVEPICTKEEWKEGTVSFCPRCGANIREYGIGQGGSFDCYECSTTIEAHVYVHEEEDDEE
ncbi:hypothetical protein P4V72_18385 [Bacillus thuringiensis]|uniref:Uncharacterized protein n=1 Tax=Bacillus thuringiensis TaxID=1428 RepID=A0A9W3TKG0_BACTU|nr:hypothetical protein [Bacillus thuringiensis]MEC3128431.1 hypothetical protein [Bacillus cereus]AQY42350.1 hypothetical protein B4918_31075 [Bacillus thuringiensis]MDO6632408.1 hypothetical protein [Bacillus thuringiensis]MDO6661901.1 hypothetical protein [Bacillus thuringiensis]MDO6702553.1 hypothetical protein [Bacillus thuringiensis]